jgi:hypothetical protein
MADSTKPPGNPKLAFLLTFEGVVAQATRVGLRALARDALEEHQRGDVAVTEPDLDTASVALATFVVEMRTRSGT